MATRKRVSRRDATLKSEDQGVLPIDEEMQDDALERAEALLKQKKLKQSPTVSKLAVRKQLTPL
jgi:hypothetical protein